MCLIVAKPRGVPLPPTDKLFKWWQMNPDGAGVSFPWNGQVRTIKGAMSFDAFKRLLKNVKAVLKPTQAKDLPLLIQYRAAVTGKPCPEFCHPFPVSARQEDLNALDVTSRYALAHNGIIREFATGYASDKNDAQEFIKAYLVPLGKQILNPTVGKLIAQATESRFAIMTPQGAIKMLGTFYEDAETKCWFSNPLFRASELPTGYSWGWYADGEIVASPDQRVYPHYRGYRPPSPYLPEASKREQAKNRLDNGLVCELCEQRTDTLYEEASLLLCRPCFETVKGRLPIAEDEYV